jgi:hypothetical protein
MVESHTVQQSVGSLHGSWWQLVAVGLHMGIALDGCCLMLQLQQQQLLASAWQQLAAAG